MIMSLNRILAVSAIALLAHMEVPAAEYPVRPIRLIVPQAPGSASDTVARLVAAELAQQLKQQIVVDNRPGGALMIGMELVKDQAARTPAKDLCDGLITRAYHHGLLLLSCGTSTVRFMPPLLVSEAQVDEAISLLEAALLEAQVA